MAGNIPELKDLEAALAESADEASARNAFVEYGKRGGLHTDAAAERLRRRLQAITGSEVVEHYGKDGLTIRQTAKPGGGSTTTPSQELASTTLSGGTPPGANAGTLLPSMPAKEMAEAIAAWNAMADALTDPSRDIDTIQGRPYRKITFWRKVRKAYGIAMIVRSKGSDSAHMTAEVEIEFTAPNGDRVTGYGYAAKAEKKLAEASLHEITSRAYSRAFCRGLRDLVGFGEPSAEEVE